MFAEPARTPYDLNFRLFGFPIRVHPLFWLMAALLGSWTLNLGIHFLAIWMLVVLLSILVHEFGHALANRYFGSDSHIVLWLLGGLAISNSFITARCRRIVVALAGPLSGLFFCGLVYLSNRLTHWGSPANGLLVEHIFDSLILVNLVWNVVNLLPVVPLDGGQVLREVCEMKWRGRGVLISLRISIIAALLIAAFIILCWIEGRSGGGPITDNLPSWIRRLSVLNAFLFGALALENYFMLERARSIYYEGPDDRVPWER